MNRLESLRHPVNPLLDLRSPRPILQSLLNRPLSTLILRLPRLIGPCYFREAGESVEIIKNYILVVELVSCQLCQSLDGGIGNLHFPKDGVTVRRVRLKIVLEVGSDCLRENISDHLRILITPFRFQSFIKHHWLSPTYSLLHFSIITLSHLF
jgi:hypothetical protein